MISQTLEDLKNGLVKDFEEHKSFIQHQGLGPCTLCDTYKKELSRLESKEHGR